MHFASQCGAGNDQAMTLKSKNAVDGQTEVSRRLFLLACEEHLRDAVAELFESAACDERERNDWRIFQRCSCNENPNVVFHLANSSLRSEVSLGDDENGSLNAEQVEDVEVLFRLGHDAVVSGNGEQSEVDTVRTREHVADEPLMPRNVDDARTTSVGQIEVRKTEIDGDTSFLLFFEAVRIFARQGFDQTRLSMINVSCGSDYVRHGFVLMSWRRGEGVEPSRDLTAPRLALKTSGATGRLPPPE